MPPWPPAATSGPFEDERRLTDEQIRALRAWAAAGVLEDEGQDRVLRRSPRPPSASESKLGNPDLILEAPAPLKLNPGGSDIFWNFVFHPDLQEPRYVRAIEIRPGQARLVHHANLLVDRSGAAARLEPKPGAGFPGMDLDLSRSPLDPVSHFLFWKPGTLPYQEPAGFSWRLNPGNLLVLNTHLQPSGKAEDIRPTIALYFTKEAPRYFPVVLELDNDRALNIPPGARHFTVSDEFTVPEDADLLAIYPHAHYLGTQLEAAAIFPGGKTKELIRIPHWDLKWQAVYRYRDRVYLPKGTVLRMYFCYSNPSKRRVHAGNNATDEMAHLGLQLLPRGDGDRRRSFTEAMARHRLAKDPNDVTAHLSLGAILLSRLRMQEALPELRTAAELDGAKPEAHDMLGAALQNTGQLQEAIAEYRRALAIAPEYASARYNLARALIKMGQPQLALPELRRVKEAFPKDARIAGEYDALASQVAAGK